MTLQRLEWRTIENTHDLYEVSEKGDIRRLGRALWVDDSGMTHRNCPPKPVKPVESLSGYLRVDLWHDGKRERRSLATIVGTAFYGPLDPDRQYVLINDDARENYNRTNITVVPRRRTRAHAQVAASRYLDVPND